MGREDSVSYKDIFDAFEKLRQEMNQNFTDLRDEISSGYVSRREFEPVRSLVYGLVGLVMVAVFTAITKLVLAFQ